MADDYPVDELQKALVQAGWSGIPRPGQKIRAGWLFRTHVAAAKCGADLNTGVALVSAELRRRLHLPNAVGVNMCARLILRDLASFGVRDRTDMRSVEDQVSNQIGTTTAALAWQDVLREERKRLPKPDFKS